MFFHFFLFLLNAKIRDEQFAHDASRFDVGMKFILSPDGMNRMNDVCVRDDVRYRVSIGFIAKMLPYVWSLYVEHRYRETLVICNRRSLPEQCLRDTNANNDKFPVCAYRELSPCGPTVLF